MISDSPSFVKGSSRTLPAYVQNVLDKADGLIRSGTGWKALCPCHDDKKQSLHIDIGDNGNVIVKCFAGCKTFDVVNAMGLEGGFDDLRPGPGEEPGEPTVTAGGESAALQSRIAVYG